MRLTQHARARAQQRGLPPLIIDWLLGYGACHEDGQGGTVYYFDRRGRRQLERECGRQLLSHLGRYLDGYAVVVGNEVVTVGHRYRPIRSN